MTSDRVLEKTINRSFIVDAVAEKLQQLSIIDDNDEVTNIQFEALFGMSENEFVPIKVYLTKTQEVPN